MKIGIATRAPEEWVEEFRLACQKEKLEFKLVDISRHDWHEQIQGLTALIWRVHLNDAVGLEEARRKIPFIESWGVRCFPNQAMLDLYDDKIRQAFFFRRYGYPTPDTFVTFSRKDALEYLSKASFPLVSKTSGGAASTGVALVRNRAEGESIVRFSFRNRGFAERLAASLRKRIALRLGFRGNTFHNAQGSRPQYGLFQEYIPSEGDLRVVALGPDIVAAAARRNRPSDFRASGGGLWEHFTEATLPKLACDMALDISNRHGFTSMAYDFLKSGDKWLVTEMSYTFPIKAPFPISLFQRCESGYKKIDPIPMGILHVRAVVH